MNDIFEVKNLGPIKDCKVEFGDITFIVGPQASGKTMFLESLYLYRYKDEIEDNLKKYSYNFKGLIDLTKLFYGDFQSNLWNRTTECLLNGINIYDKEQILLPFIDFIPAQRSVTIIDGRFKNFNEFDLECSYIVKEFSEILRNYTSIKNFEDFKFEYIESIYHKGHIFIDDSTFGQKKFRMKVGDSNIPFSSWSMGQKEFTPLSIFLQGSPYDWIPGYLIIEEPELGLHPQAILDFMSYLITNVFCNHQKDVNTKLIISTHSDTIIQLAWALVNLAENATEEEYIKNVSELLNIKGDTQNLKYLYQHKDNIKTFFFKDGVSKDISSLDAWSDDEDVVEWGGLTSFISKSGNIVANYKASKNG